MKTADWTREREICTKFYNDLIEEDQKWFENRVKEYFINNPDASPEEAFRAGYILSEMHPLSRTIHNIVLYTDDYYPHSRLNTEHVIKTICTLFRKKDINYKTEIELIPS